MGVKIQLRGGRFEDHKNFITQNKDFKKQKRRVSEEKELWKVAQETKKKKKNCKYRVLVTEKANIWGSN